MRVTSHSEKKYNMDWHILWSTFVLATFKFLFSGIPGAKLGAPIWEVTVASALGGYFSAIIFYFASEKVIEFQNKRRAQKVLKGTFKPKKKFTRTNKWVVKIKQTFGILGLTYLAPLFLSVPVGSVICAKFYSENKYTFPLIILWISVNSVLLNLLWYGLFG